MKHEVLRVWALDMLLRSRVSAESKGSLPFSCRSSFQEGRQRYTQLSIMLPARVALAAARVAVVTTCARTVRHAEILHMVVSFDRR